MTRIIFQTIILLIVLNISFSCSKKSDEKDFEIKEGTGTVWLSGGLAYCATQIRMEKGDTLIPVNEFAVLSYSADDKVQVKYKELDSRESGCSIGKDCEIIEIELIE